jgi:hypothetical protein
MTRPGHVVTADQLYDLVADMWRRMPGTPPEEIAGAVLASAGMRPIDNPLCYAAALQALIVIAMDVDDDLRSSGASHAPHETMH